MDFIPSQDGQEGVDAMAHKLIASLQENLSVLWLVCGGSNVPLAARALARVRQEVPEEQLENLTFALTDERFGPPGHTDSNWQQLLEAGCNFDAMQAIPILQGESLEKTVETYARRMDESLQEADLVVAQFGIGADGHIAGMLPHTPGIAAKELVFGYDAPPFVRVTLTPPAFAYIDMAYAFAFDEAKHEAITKLWQKDLTISEMPCQILKRIPDAYFYTDQVS